MLRLPQPLLLVGLGVVACTLLSSLPFSEAGRVPPWNIALDPVPTAALLCSFQGGNLFATGGEKDKCFYVPSVRHDYNTAEQYCKARCGNLAQINSQEESTFVFDTIRQHGPPQNSGDHVYIGLHQRVPESANSPYEHIWHWTTGKVANFFVWAYGEPNDNNGVEHCAAYSGGRSEWNDIGCNGQEYFVCQVFEGDGVLVTTPPEQQKCAAYSGVWMDDKCFFIPTSEKVTWHIAKGFCAGGGGHLASPVSHDQNEALSMLYQSTGRNQGWIGLTDTASEGTFVWATGSTSTYKAWAHGEPNNYGDGEEDCTMYWKTGSACVALCAGIAGFDAGSAGSRE